MVENYPDEPTDIAKIDSTEYDSILVGENDLGSVYIHGPFGNPESEVKIAYIIGMHPFESKVHRALFEAISAMNDLNYSYYVYNINIAEVDPAGEGRLTGQLLGQEFIVGDVKKSNYDLVVDIHSNKGLNGPGTYEITNFLFAPGFDEQSTDYLNTLIDKIEELAYYAPEHRTSPPYVTEPISQSGIPTIIYETYSYESMDITCDLIKKLIMEIDNLVF